MDRREYQSQYYKENKEKLLEYRKAWAARNKLRVKKLQREKYLRNIEQIKAATKRAALDNPERTRTYKRKWDKLNPGKANAKTARRYASKVQATPAWRNEFFIEEAYDLASRRTKIMGVKWHVDHIVPLRSSVVCGLHVEQNLQVIPAIVNQKKNNRYWPDMPEREAA